MRVEVFLGVLMLAWRNLLRSWPRRWPVIVVLAASTAVLEFGNTLLDGTADGLRRTYVASLTGDWSVSAAGRESFTLFGSELPLVGEYYVLPTIPDADAVLHSLQTLPGTRGVVGQVTAGAVLSLDGWSSPVPVFGVEARPYFSLFDDIKLLDGSLDPMPGSIFLSQEQQKAIARAVGHLPAIGETLTLTAFNDSTFVIRPVKLSGIYRRASSDDVTDRIVLTDPDTARALNGYVSGTRKGGGIAKGMGEGEVDSLFTDTTDQLNPVTSSSLFGEVENALKDSTQRDSQNAVRQGSWNFFLVRGERPQLDGLVVRDWKESAGGRALIVWVVQLIFNIGMVAVLFGAAVVGINSLALAVTERIREIGTLRAMGASRMRVVGFIAAEVLFTVTGAGVIGIVCSLVVLSLFAWLGIPLANPYLQALFGTDVLRPHPTWSAVAGQLAVSLGLGIIAILQPVWLALRIRPVQAIERVS